MVGDSRFPIPDSWTIRDASVALARPIILGILNVTPDSFSDGGKHASTQQAIARAEQMIDEGADIIDVGGESTRPQGATEVSTEVECARVLPLIEALTRSHPAIPLSIDTTKSAVARAALDAGARIVNDVSAFRLDPRMGEIVAATRAGVILMHSRGGVSDMATFVHATYGADVMGDVRAELMASVERALQAGVARDAIVLDPGIGFAKRGEHSVAVLAALARLVATGYAVAVGVSRKRFIGEISGVQRPDERVNGSIGANVVALMRGARLFRVHDVRAHREALDVAWRIVREA